MNENQDKNVKDEHGQSEPDAPTPRGMSDDLVDGETVDTPEENKEASDHSPGKA